MDKKQYVWSLDEENYNHGIYDTFEEAIEEAELHNWDADDEDRVEYAFIAELKNNNLINIKKYNLEKEILIGG